MVNLISINAQSFTDFPHHINVLWSSVMSIIISMVFLFLQLGSASFAGVLLMAVFIPITSFLQNKCKSQQTTRLKHQDSRVKIINELLNGIKVVKLYGWELSFNFVINKIRANELRILKLINYLNGVSGFSLSIMPFLVSVASFGAYLLLNKEPLTAEKTFVSLALFNTLKQPLFILPQTLSNIIQVCFFVTSSILINDENLKISVVKKANISLARITSFLLSSEINSNEISHISSRGNLFIFKFKQKQ
jgi:ABC-type multidrug transport system fused ATPase/permease subunit